VVSLTAAAAPSGQVFDRWTGASVANAYASSTTLVMPASHTTVTAAYKTTTTSVLSRLLLINADTNQPLMTLWDGMTLKLSALATRNLNVQAVTSPAVVGSVRFAVSPGTGRVETAAPYAMAGDTDGNYSTWTPPLGTVTITATPYSAAGGAGTAGSSLTVRLNVVQ
jgi:hypothetical protein